MAEISLIELIVYSVITYTGVIGLIVSAFRTTPQNQADQSATRVIWLIPSIFTAFMLASSGAAINLEDTTVTSIQVNLNTTETWQETVTTSQTMTLVNPVWVTLHLLLFFILLIYVIINILTAFTRIR